MLKITGITSAIDILEVTIDYEEILIECDGVSAKLDQEGIKRLIKYIDYFSKPHIGPSLQPEDY